MQPNFLNASNHYENFPVASWFLPKKTRDATLSFYKFARLADDIADCTDISALQKIELLELTQIFLLNKSQETCKETSEDKQVEIIKNTTNKLSFFLNEHSIDPKLVCNLLVAFKMDATFKNFPDWQSLFNYCKYSANPVGRFLLHLMGVKSLSSTEREAIFQLSDSICTALQIINFAQDFKEDISNSRCYLPMNFWPVEMKNNGFEASLKLNNKKKNELILKLVGEGEKKLIAGKNLPKLIRQTSANHRIRFALEIALIIECGMDIVEQIKASPETVWSTKPKLRLKRTPFFIYNSILNIF